MKKNKLFLALSLPLVATCVAAVAISCDTIEGDSSSNNSKKSKTQGSSNISTNNKNIFTKEELKAFIKNKENQVKGKEYTKETKQNFETALATAKKVASKDKPTVEEIANVKKALNKASIELTSKNESTSNILDPTIKDSQSDMKNPEF